MPIKLTAAFKGFITAILMIAAALIIDAKRNTTDPRMQYFILIIYAVGVAWAIISFRQSAQYTAGFAPLFGQGFRCFIVVTLVMAVFSVVFVKMHPEFAEEEAKYQRELLLKDPDTLPNEVDGLVAKVKKQYVVRYLSRAIFGYLVIGAGATAVVCAFATRRPDSNI
jgi:hypothetical protein